MVQKRLMLGPVVLGIFGWFASFSDGRLHEAQPSNLNYEKSSFSYHLLTLALLILLGVPLAQAQISEPTRQEEWARVLAAAKKEGRVVVLGPPGADVRNALTLPFQTSYPGIVVEYSGASGATIVPRLMTERRAGQYLVDVHVGGTTTMLVNLRPAGILDPIRPALIRPEVTDPSKWWQGLLDFADREARYNLVFSTNVKAPLAVNAQTLKPELHSYWDLTHPKWSAKLAMRDPTTAGSGNVTAVFWYAHPALGKDFMRKLFTQQKVAFTRDDRQLLEWVARGDRPIGIAHSDLVATQLKAKGFPLEVIGAEHFKEGSYITPGFGSVALINRAPHPNAAKVYLNWLLSKEGQTEWSKAAGYASRRLDVSRDHLHPSLVPKEGISYQPNYKEEYVKLTEEVFRFLREILKN